MQNQKQRGMTLTEVLITSVVLVLIIGIGLLISHNVSIAQRLAADESKMQQKSRTAISKIKQELRQAKKFYAVPPAPLPDPNNPEGPLIQPPYSYDIIFTVPETDVNGLLTGNYKLTRYWYDQNPSTKVWSLKRAAKSNGNTPNFAVPDPNNPLTDNMSFIVREAAVVDPGQQSYFLQRVDNTVNPPVKTASIMILLVTATYKTDASSATATVQKLDRVFRVETEVEARNMEL